MTPLARRLAKQLLMARKDRHPFWRDEKNAGLLRSCLDDVHCFDVTQIAPLRREVWERGGTGSALFRTFSFLPAPKCWIETAEDPDGRIALFTGDRGDGRALVYSFVADHCEPVGEIGLNSEMVYTAPPKVLTPEQVRAKLTPAEIEIADKRMLASLMLDLVLINSPRIIGRRQHMPHAGLEKKLTRNFGPGQFPLHAWTEILLQVRKPPEIDDGEPHEAHLTGKRALHFCRKHIRIRLGQLEYVSAHWRGDPAIGIKRSRYLVTP